MAPPYTIKSLLPQQKNYPRGKNIYKHHYLDGGVLPLNETLPHPPKSWGVNGVYTRGATP